MNLKFPSYDIHVDQNLPFYENGRSENKILIIFTRVVIDISSTFIFADNFHFIIKNNFARIVVLIVIVLISCQESWHYLPLAYIYSLATRRKTKWLHYVNIHIWYASCRSTCVAMLTRTIFILANGKAIIIALKKEFFASTKSQIVC